MKRYLLLLVPVLALSMFACKRDDDGEGGNTVTPGSGFRTLEEALVSAAPKMLSTGMSISAGDTLYCGGGTCIMIPPNGFETLNGVRAVGSANISYQDWNRKGDMVYGHILPLQDGRPLVTIGQAFLSVTQNGQALRVSKDTELVFQFPLNGAAPGAIAGYTGRTKASATDIVNWFPLAPDGKLRPLILPDSINLIADTIGYVAVSEPIVGLPALNFSVLVNSPVPLESSLAVALYDGMRAVYPLPFVSNSRINARNIPGAPMHIAVMGINKGVFYAGLTTVSAPASDSSYTVKLISTDPANFRLTMNAL